MLMIQMALSRPQNLVVAFRTAPKFLDGLSIRNLPGLTWEQHFGGIWTCKEMWKLLSVLLVPLRVYLERYPGSGMLPGEVKFIFKTKKCPNCRLPNFRSFLRSSRDAVVLGNPSQKEVQHDGSRHRWEGRDEPAGEGNRLLESSAECMRSLGADNVHTSVDTSIPHFFQDRRFATVSQHPLRHATSRRDAAIHWSAGTRADWYRLTQNKYDTDISSQYTIK